MSSSDLFTILAILLAVYALLNEEQRKYYHLKFSTFDLFSIVVLLGLVHFLVSFSWWSQHYDWLKTFHHYGWPTTGAYAYLFSSLLIGYILWLLMKAYYAKGKEKKIMEFYHDLINKKDYELLAKLIRRFHNPYADKYFQLRREADEIIEKNGANDLSPWTRQRDQVEKIYSEKIKGKKAIYAGIAFSSAITNEVFIDDACNDYPHLFCPWIKNLNTQALANPEFVNRFLRNLLKNRNGILFRELRNNQNFKNGSSSYRIEKSRYILYALFNDIKVAVHNEVWRGVGEEAIYELINERNKESSLLREQEIEQDEYKDTIWSFRITNAIWFFDIMVRESVYQNAERHMLMHYYHYFTRDLLKNMSPNGENTRTRNFDLIRLIFSNLLSWIDVTIETQNIFSVPDIFRCYGQCMYEVVASNRIDMATSSDLSCRLFNRVIRIYTSPEQSGNNQEVLDSLMNNLIDTYCSPLNRFDGDDLIKYKEILRLIWDNRDRPSEHFPKRVERFEKEIIKKYL